MFDGVVHKFVEQGHGVVEADLRQVGRAGHGLDDKSGDKAGDKAVLSCIKRNMTRLPLGQPSRAARHG